MDPAEERSYVRQARADPRAFVHLYDHYFPRIHAYVRYRIHRRQDAEDVIAEVFLAALRRLDRFEWRHDNAFAAWLFRIAHNMVVEYYRRHGRAEDLRSIEATAGSVWAGSPNALAEAASRAPQPEEALVRRESFRQMRALIETLSPRRQEVITLRFFGGLRNREIARVLGLDERTIALHLSRGLPDHAPGPDRDTGISGGREGRAQEGDSDRSLDAQPVAARGGRRVGSDTGRGAGIRIHEIGVVGGRRRR